MRVFTVLRLQVQFSINFPSFDNQEVLKENFMYLPEQNHQKFPDNLPNIFPKIFGIFYGHFHCRIFKELAFS